MREFTRTIPAKLTTPYRCKVHQVVNYQNERTQHLLRDELCALTEQHCSYCDCLLHITEYTPHIEHFKPKATFNFLESIWENLYISCPLCNSNKGYKIPKIKPLRPDSVGYQFSKWFRINYQTGEILPKVFGLSQSENERAQATIDWLGLNKNGKPEARKKELMCYERNGKRNVNNYSFRFYLR